MRKQLIAVVCLALCGWFIEVGWEGPASIGGSIDQKPLQFAFPILGICQSSVVERSSSTQLVFFSSKKQHKAWDQRPHAQTGRRALLIGCSQYSNLSPDLWLKGPAADVAITRETLMDPRYGFKDSEITVMSSESTDPSLRPTLQNIHQQFEKLCVEVQTGDHVFILLSGHGGQQPNRNPEDDPERDGLDEVFVPEDVSGWDRSSQEINRDVILDDQIGTWLSRIQAKKAMVFFVADTCHSGSINRGPEEPEDHVRTRSLPPWFQPDDVREIPEKNLSSIENGSLLMDVPAGVVALFAVPANSLAREQPMPPRGQVGSLGVHGRLSFAFNEVLRTARRPLSYRELSQQLRAKHSEWSWSPLPYIDGESDVLDYQLFGMQAFPDRSRFELKKNQFGLELNAGWLDQIEIGSIFAVYPPAGNADSDQARGYVRVLASKATTSKLEPCEFEQHSKVALEQLPLLGRCELVYRELGETRLPVMVIGHTQFPASAETLNRVKASLREICKDQRTLVRETINPEESEIFVEVTPDEIVIRRKYNLQEVIAESDEAANAAQVILPFKITDDLDDALKRRLVMVARAISLSRMAQHQNFGPPLKNWRSNFIDLKTIVRLKRVQELDFQVVDDPTTLILNEGDIVRVEVHNQGKSSIDVTGLLVESGFAIKSMRLAKMHEGRLTPADHRIPPNGEPVFFSVKIRELTIGVEELILIAVPATDAEPRIFRELEQRGIDTLVLDRPNASRGVNDSPLDQILASTIFTGSLTRGSKFDDPDFAIRRIFWTVERSGVDNRKSPSPAMPQ